MKRRILCFVLCIASVMGLGACRRETPASEGYQLYFPRSRSSSYGSALVPQPWENETPEEDVEAALLKALLAGPTEENLISPFPRGTSVQSIAWDEEEPGTLMVTLTEQYGGLTDISQTLADACIVLTLSQIPEVERVEISSSGSFGTQKSRTLSVEQMEVNSLLS